MSSLTVTLRKTTLRVTNVTSPEKSVVVEVKEGGTIFFTKIGARGAQGDPGLPGAQGDPGTTEVPEVLDGGNF